MLPVVIPEELISLFKYWQEEVRVGMMYQNELYEKIRVYALDNRLTAYEDSYHLASINNKLLCITVSPSGYTLWQCLRSRPADEEDSISKKKALPAYELARCA